MGARRRLPPHSPPRWAAIAAVTLCTDTRCLTAAMPTATGSASDTASTLFACGSHDNDFDNSKQIVDLFNATKSVCCDDPREECNGKDVLPATCHTPGCARAVDIVSRSCAAVLADGFLGKAFGSALEPLVSACSDAEIEREPTYVISDPGLHAASIETCHGLVIDGAGSTFLPSYTGLDALVLRAPAGVQLQLTVEALCLPKSANVRIYDGETNNDAQLALLQRSGHHGDTFLSTGGVLQVQRSVDEEDTAGMPLLFGLRIGCVCSAEGPNLCGEHSSCVDGKCQCDAGYGGPMCESIVDKCKAPVEVDCGAHGSCAAGTCECDDGFFGGSCEFAPNYEVTNVPSNVGSTGFGPLASVNGVYALDAQKLCHGKPVYKKSGLMSYYFVLFQTGNGIWAIGKTGSDTACDGTKGLYISQKYPGTCRESPDADGCKGRWAIPYSGGSPLSCCLGGAACDWEIESDWVAEPPIMVTPHT